MINKVLVFLMLLFPNGSTGMDEGSKYTGIVAKRFSKKMEKYDLHAIGIGEGINHDTKKQNHFSVVFTIESLPNIETARCLIVQALESLQRDINAEIGIRKYLDTYPYPIKYIEVGIINKDKNESLFSVSNLGNEIIYRINDTDPVVQRSIEYLRETFEEALQKVNCSK